MKNMNFIFNKEKRGHILEESRSIYIEEKRKNTTEIDTCDMIDVLS